MSTESSPGTPAANRPSVCVCVNVRRAARAITRVYDQALAPVDLKVTQFSALANIMHSGPLNISRLAKILQLDRTTLVRNLKALEASGFIENGASSDPRERTVQVTSSGRTIVERAMPCWKNAQKRVEAELGRENVRQLGLLAVTLEKLSGDGSAGDGHQQTPLARVGK